MAYSRWIHRFELRPDVWVFVPDDEAREYGNKIKLSLETSWACPPYYAHLRPGGHVKALRRHTKNEIFFRLDIKNFFNSIGKSRVTRVLRDHYSHIEAREIAKMSLVPHPHTGTPVLPFGFVQSPILASLCLRASALGRALEDLYKERHVDVTVYVDDIIVSTRKRLRETESIFESLIKKAERSRFELSPEKLSPPETSIESFNILLSNSTLTLTENRLTEFREKLEKEDNDRVRQGILAYVRSVNPNQAAALNKFCEG